MMKARLVLWAVLLWGMAWSPPGWADERASGRLAVIGNCATANGNIIAQGRPMSAVSVAANASATTVGFYDTTTLGGTTTANLKFEIQVAANDTKFIDLRETPVDFANGITAVFSNGNAACAYEVTNP